MSPFGINLCEGCRQHPCQCERAEAEQELPEGGYCFDCRIAFSNEQYADAHYHMTGHQIGYPLEDVQWPYATEEQVYGR